MEISQRTLVVGINTKQKRFFGIVVGGCKEDGYLIRTIKSDGSFGKIVGCLAKDITPLRQLEEDEEVTMGTIYGIMMALFEVLKSGSFVQIEAEPYIPYFEP